MAIKKITVCAVLTALGVVLAEIVPAVKTPIIQISFYFVPIALAAMMYGASYSVIIAALIDIIGTLTMGVGAFNPIFTVTAALNGLIFGAFLYRGSKLSTKNDSLDSIITAFLSATLITLILNSFNIALITYVDKGVTLGERWIALMFPTRILQWSVMFPLQAVVMVLLKKLVLPRLSFLTPARAKI
ncbi:MAG: folate family ECF transporter S component [Oscillospiraceae bacterium]|jgi:ECF transporter S component (folate family)|nr:folate family ECF transporter S component [Oscillospiraceae bacterium]